MYVLKPGIPDLNRTPKNLTLRKMKRPREGLGQIESRGRGGGGGYKCQLSVKFFGLLSVVS